MGYMLTLNAGSSSIKFRVFENSSGLSLVSGGKVSAIGGKAVFSFHGEVEKAQVLRDGLSHDEALSFILDWIDDQRYGIDVVVHRIVHGGTKYTGAALLNDSVMTDLRGLVPLAPLHQPHNLAAVDMVKARYPDLAQYGCFDTAFHAQHDPLFCEMALPQFIRDQGVRRYGFHGLSYQWIAHCLSQDHPRLAKGNVVAAHLGNGASLCAIRDGKSIETTMGMTALDGLPMGTRSGAIDPGAVLYMMRDPGLSVDEVEDVLYHQSGLKGLSGVSNDVEALLQSGDERAAFALRFFALKTAQYIAAMAVSMGGMDGLIFTGGIGENAEDVRRMILEYLAFLPDFEVHIIPANEERAMAMSVMALHSQI